MTQLLTAIEAAKYIGVSRRQLLYLATGGEITYYRPGATGRYLFRPEWLDEYIKKNTVRAV